MKNKSIRRCIVLVMALMLLAATTAYAGIGTGATPDYPQTVTVGATNVPVAIELINTNFGGEVTHPNEVTSIFHIPSCGSSLLPGACIGTAINPGVFSVSATGTGRVGTACESVVFTITVSDPTTGEVSMTPASTIILQPPGSPTNSNCIIDFSVNVNALPSVDASVATALQTAQHGRVLVRSTINTNLTGGGSGTDVTTVVGCGDGIVGNTTGETCDPPGSTPTTPTGNQNSCRANCTYCGDGIVNNVEACDDGNTNNNDSCRNNCSLPVCGDGILDPGEACDDGNTNNNDACRNDCTYCGDGVVQIGAGEQCDDGNTNNNDACNNFCKQTRCEVNIIKETSCDGGSTWGDGCSAQGTADVSVRYRYENTGTANLFSCTVNETNTLIPDITAPFNLSVGGGEATNLRATDECSTLFGGGEPDTATITCDCFNAGNNTKATDNDTSSFSCAGEETCRTPGFWATHAGTEKRNSKNITYKVIADATGCIEICGEIINDTDLNSPDSAVEAMCVRVQGNSRLQLVRQLTAAALNCVVSGGGSDCTGISIEDVYKACNVGCAANAFPVTVGLEQLSVSNCINRIDCFNNGGEWAAGKCWYGVCDLNHGQYCNTNAECPGNTVTVTNPCIPIPGNCHDRLLGMCANGSICTEENTYIDANEKARCIADNSLCVPGPAGSSTKCNNAINNRCTVISPGEGSCGNGDNKTDPGLESCY